MHDYFGYEEDNTHWKLHLLMKIGGGGEDGPAKGIHWHMNINNTIEYVATDDKRLEIPWVQSTSADGRSRSSATPSRISGRGRGRDTRPARWTASTATTGPRTTTTRRPRP